jgi:hypothetical protein
VKDNKTASDLALREAYAILWSDYTRKVWQLTEYTNAQKLAIDVQIAELRAKHANDIEVASERLRLLERSPWQKFMDWCKTLRMVRSGRGWFRGGVT